MATLTKLCGINGTKKTHNREVTMHTDLRNNLQEFENSLRNATEAHLTEYGYDCRLQELLVEFRQKFGDIYS